MALSCCSGSSTTPVLESLPKRATRQLQTLVQNREHDLVERSRKQWGREPLRERVGHGGGIVAEHAAPPGAEHQATVAVRCRHREHMGSAAGAGAVRIDARKGSSRRLRLRVRKNGTRGE